MKALNVLLGLLHVPRGFPRQSREGQSRKITAATQHRPTGSGWIGSFFNRFMGTERATLCEEFFPELKEKKATWSSRPSCIGDLALVLSLLVVAGCATQKPQSVLWQNTPMIALFNGNYDAIMTVGEAKKHGDFGIGAFDRLDGEMLALDGVVYQVTSDGKVHRPPDTAGLCFTAVTRFAPEHEAEIPRGTVFTNLAQLIDPKLPTVNAFYAMRVKGTFSAITTRAVPAQQKPYLPLCEVVKTQPKFHFENVAGTLVGFRGPPYIATLNAPGYHFHFLTADETGGGHVLSFTVDHAVLEWSRIDRNEIGFPTDANFNSSDLKKINNCSGAEGPSAE